MAPMIFIDFSGHGLLLNLVYMGEVVIVVVGEFDWCLYFQNERDNNNKK